jgi:hypothetical protein
VGADLSDAAGARTTVFRLRPLDFRSRMAGAAALRKNLYATGYRQHGATKVLEWRRDLGVAPESEPIVVSNVAAHLSAV